MSAYRDWHLQVPQGQRTEACLRNNISVGVQYLEAWLGGMGCVPLHNLMEDAATAEIGRTQVWQWIHHKATLDDKDVLTVSRFNQVSLEGLRLFPQSFTNVFAWCATWGVLTKKVCSSKTRSSGGVAAFLAEMHVIVS